MSNIQDGTSAAGLQRRDVPLEWEALEDAFENNAPEVHSYLHLATGEVLRVVDGVADPGMHARIASDPGYLKIEAVTSREQYRWMERFIELVEDDDLALELRAAIDGKGAFRRFKDVLMTHAEAREQWFTFRSDRLRVFMEAWLEAHALRAVPRPPLVVPVVRREVSEVPSALGPVRKTKGTELLRRQLLETLEGLGARDLDKILAFAEFVRLRRSGRGVGHADEAEAEAETEVEPEASSAAVAERPAPEVVLRRGRPRAP